MGVHFDPECCTWDSDGNPDVCLGPPREEPDCYTCGDRGTVPVNPMQPDGPRRNCPECNPTDSDIAHATITHQIRVGTGNYDPTEPVF